jgi:hypothetical protein
MLSQVRAGAGMFDATPERDCIIYDHSVSPRRSSESTLCRSNGLHRHNKAMIARTA